MRKYQKMIILLLISLSVYFVYIFTNKNNITYLAIGDSLTFGQNNYGGKTYGYTDFVRDYLNKNSKKTIYIDKYTTKDKEITTLYNDILTDKSIIVDNKKYNLKRLLQESNIITMSIGLNDVIYEYSLKNKRYLSNYEEERIINHIFEQYEELLEEIKRYNTRPIYIIGYPTKNKYGSLLEKLNNKYKESCGKSNNIFIDSDKLLNNNIYFDDENSIFPNYQGYNKIAKQIIKDYNLQNK